MGMLLKVQNPEGSWDIEIFLNKKLFYYFFSLDKKRKKVEKFLKKKINKKFQKPFFWKFSTWNIYFSCLFISHKVQIKKKYITKFHKKISDLKIFSFEVYESEIFLSKYR